MRTIKKVSLIIILLFAITAAGFVAWANTPLAAMTEALDALHTDSLVKVSEGKWIAFQAAGTHPDTGLILYPGGRVDPRAYAPAAREIAQQGYFVVIAPMPLNLAVFDSGRAAEIIAAYPQITRWVIGGHSLGGAMAARFAYQNPASVRGLALWAAYPASSDDLSTQTIEVVSIIGSLDGLGTSEGVEVSRRLLPQSTRFVVIEGGNHAQFGWYGEQPGDARAAITRMAQQEQVIQATLDLLGIIKRSS